MVLKLAVATVVVLGLVFLFPQVQRGAYESMLSFLSEQSPIAASLIEKVAPHISQGDVIGVAIASFLLRLPLTPFPYEPYIIYVYSIGADKAVTGVVTSVFGTLAGLVSYGIGALLGDYAIWGEEAHERKERIQESRFVAPSVFGAALLPIPDFVMIIFGALHVGWKRFAVYFFLGLLTKAYIMAVMLERLLPYAQAFV